MTRLSEKCWKKLSMSNMEKSVAMPLDVFRLLRDLIAEYCGIFYDDDSRYILELRLSRRLRILGLDDYRDYYRFLLFDRRRDDELANIVDVLTVNETYFFREERQFRAFSEEICTELKSSRAESRKIRIWSAGCATGEEPYTVAMLLNENPSMFRGWDIEILGSDINQRVLRTAKDGIYRKNSFRATDAVFMDKYFKKEDGEYKLRDEVRTLVNFNRLNLLDAGKVHLMGKVDIVFFRNVLIYFHAKAKKQVIENIYHRLSDGGYLLLGHAESLVNVSTSFALKHLKNDMVYQKPRRSGVSMSDESLFRLVRGK